MIPVVAAPPADQKVITFAEAGRMAGEALGWPEVPSWTCQLQGAEGKRFGPERAPLEAGPGMPSTGYTLHSVEQYIRHQRNQAPN
jgi:hypothetical protein